MTIRECIDRINESKPNTFSDEEKVRWLAYLDGILWKETFATHERRHHRDGEEDEPVFIDTRYTVDDLQRHLLAPYPFDELYIAFCGLKIDELNGETIRYNNSAAMFNELKDDYTNWFHRTHRPIRSKINFR